MTEKEKLELSKFISQRISKAVEDLYVDLQQMYNNDMDRPIDYCQGEFDAMVKLAKEITETVVWNLEQKADDYQK